MSVSLVTTVRAAHDARIRDLEYMLAWYAPVADWELLVVEQDSAPRLDSTAWPSNVRHVFVPNPGPFNKGWGLNVGAGLTNRTVLFLCDADLLVARDALQTASTLCQRRVLAVNPYDRLRDLDQDESEAVLGKSLDPDFAPERAQRTRGSREILSFCAGAFFIRHDLYRALGGFDERFVGWGGEDDAMTLKLTRATREVAELERRTAVHLWHPRPDTQTFGNPHYARNRARLGRLQALDEPAFRFLCDVQRQLMGNPEKYRVEPTGDSAPG